MFEMTEVVSIIVKRTCHSEFISESKSNKDDDLHQLDKQQTKSTVIPDIDPKRK